MNKVLKRLFEKIETVTEPVTVVLKAFWNDERSGPYKWASVCTALILIVSTQTSNIWASYPMILIYGVALGIFLIILVALKNFPDGDQVHYGAPLRTGQKIIKAVAIPFVVLVAIIWATPYYFKSTGHYASFVSSLGEWPTIVAIVAVIIILIGISIWNYKTINEQTSDIRARSKKPINPQLKSAFELAKYLIYYFSLLGLGLVLFYYSLPYILPYIQSFIGYVMTLIG
jgi:hypothetical protein